MSLDQRIETKTRPMYGCHSDLDKYKQDVPQDCNFEDPHAERACEGCQRKKEDDGQ